MKPILPSYRRAALALLTVLGPAAAQTGSAVAAGGDEPVRLDQYVALGTRFHDRTLATSPVPVTLYDASDLQAVGYQDFTQVLATIDPGIDFPHPTNQDGYDSARAAAFSGLAPDQTLVLLNGKRYHTSALVHANGSIGKAGSHVDFNSFPAFALGGAEILRGGASAQYGSDAIAGVVNLTLRRDLGARLTTTLGQYEHGDGATFSLSGNFGSALGSRGGFVNVTAFVKTIGSTDRSGYDQRQQYFGTNPATGAPVLPGSTAGVINGTPDPREAVVRRHNSVIGNPSDHSRGVFLNLASPVSSLVEVYAFGGLTGRHSTAFASWRRAADDNTLRSLYPNGFQAQIQPHLRDLSATLGARGNAAGWKWDLSQTYGSSDVSFYSAHSANVSFGAASPSAFFDGQVTFAQAVTNLDLAREFAVGLPAPLKFATGVEFRTEGFQIHQGEYASWANGGARILDGPNQGNLAPIGAQGFPGFQPGDEINAHRDNLGGYVELENQLTSRWNLQLSGRAEHYDDAGSAVTGKAATLYQLLPWLGVRASFANGFRAPALQQEYLTSTSEVAVNVGGVSQPLAVRTFGVNNPAAVALGATRLRPEKSTNFSTGFTFQAGKGFSGSLDYFNVRVADQVVVSSNFTGTSVASYLAGLGSTGLNGGRYFTNGVGLRNQGFDASARYRWRWRSADHLTLAAAYTGVFPRVTSAQATPANVLALTGGTPILDRQTTLRIQRGFPLGRAVLSQTYDWGRRLTFLLREAWYGRVLNSGTTAALDQWLNPQWVADVEATWHLTPRLAATFGANNVLNTYPNRLIPALNTSGLTQFSQISPYGYDGGFYYTRLDVRF